MAPATTKLRAQSGRGRGDPISDLQRIGFSEYEARTYLSLLKVNPATAYEVSKHSGLPRANTYGALDALTKKRAVQPVTEAPVRYAPVRPEILLDRLTADVSAVCERLRDSLEDLEEDDSSDVVWSLSGQEQIARKIDELIDGARSQVWIKAATSMLHQHLDALKRAAERGVAFVFVVFGQDIAFLDLGPRCRIYLHEGNGVRIGGADNLFTVAVDYRAALTANVTGELTGAYTTNPSVVRMAETLIRHDVYMAEIMLAFPALVEQRFGPNLVSLRERMFSADQVRLMRRNLDARVPPESTAGPAAGARPPEVPGAPKGRKGSTPPAVRAPSKGPKRVASATRSARGTPR